MNKKDLGVVFVGILAAIYLVNPTAGIFELIPDAIPGIGNLDEGFAVYLLISVFRYFGFDAGNFFRREKQIVNDDKMDN